MNLKSGRLLFPCVLLESFEFFPPDPYYEPLSWFMIQDIYIYIRHTEVCRVALETRTDKYVFYKSKENAIFMQL